MSTTLLLNASFEPLGIISLRRAISLLLNGKAILVEAAEEGMRTLSYSIPRPKVIRLVSYVRIPYRKSAPLSRAALMARDRGTCQYCFKAGDTIDHVLPRAKGGQHIWENVVIACKKCNNKKDDRLLSDIGWSLPREPVAPTVARWLVVALAKGDPVWSTYLDPMGSAV